MKGSDNVFGDDSIASQIPVISHLTYNELHVLIIGVIVGVASAHLLSRGFAVFVLLANAAVVGALLGVGLVQTETRMVSLLRQESWYYLGGVVGGYGAYVVVVA